jgi:hypothetical protein
MLEERVTALEQKLRELADKLKALQTVPAVEEDNGGKTKKKS